jgi:transposase
MRAKENRRPSSRRGCSPIPGTKQAHRRQIEPDWASIRRELKRKHVTLSILWDEYIKRKPQG